MSGKTECGKLDRVVEDVLPGASSASVHCDPGNPAPPPNKWLHVQNWKLKKLLEQKDAKIDELTNKLKRMEAELVSEVQVSGDLVVEMVEGKVEAARKLEEKDIDIQELKKTARKAEIEQYLWTAGLKTSSMFQNQTDGMSAEEKVLQLFPDVLKIIIQNARKVDNCVHWPALLPLLTACRPVCNSWKESVDLIMAQDSSHFDICPRGVNLFKYKRDYTPTPLKLSYYKFNNARWNDKFTKLSQDHKGNPSYNPIPSRHLLIETIDHRYTPEHDLEKWKKFNKTVVRYLMLLQKQVWFLTVDLRGSIDITRDRDPAGMYNVLRLWLSALPNVMSFALNTGSSRISMMDQEEIDETVLLPKFRNLITFQGYRDSPLTYKILENNRRIKNLGLSTHFGSIPPPQNFLELDLPSVFTFKCSFDNLEDWRKFLKMSWKLTELSLRYNSKLDPLSTKAFFEGIQTFGKTLQSLAIGLGEVGWNDSGVNLNLPQLKHLHLRSHGWEPMSPNKVFAPLALEKLESLLMELSVSYGSPSKEELYSFLDYVNEFHKSYDWMKFPKLRNVKVIVRVNGYELGGPQSFEVKRSDMSSVKFDVVEISECHIWHLKRL